MEGKWLTGVMVMVIAVVVMVAGQASASSPTPNSFFSCMNNCPGYNCVSPHYRAPQECFAYCLEACAFPGANLVNNDPNHYCNIGCTSSKCSKTIGTKAGVNCMNTCSHICTSKPASIAAVV